MKLKDKVAIVTGAGRGLGKEIACALAEAGADAVLVARTHDEIKAVGTEVTNLGRKALVVPADVSAEKQVNQMVQKAIAQFGRVDILVNNAGGPLKSYRTRVLDLTLSDWQAVFDVNVFGTFLCCQAVLPHMMKQKGGVIINISSGMGQRGHAGNTAYSASKFAVEGLSQAMALEFSPWGIRVNTLSPGGLTATPGMIRQHPDLPVDRMLDPKIIRGVVVYLASDDSTGVTGQSFTATTWNLDQLEIHAVLKH